MVKLETRADGVAIAWLANGQMNSLSPQVVEDLGKVWTRVKAADPPVRALVIASSNPFLFWAGADIKAFTTMDEAARAELIDGRTRCSASSGRRHRHDRGRQRPGLRRRLRARDGLRCAHRSALSAVRQPEIKLGIIPGFGGTQRLPRLVGVNKALEMNLIGDPILADEAFELGLANRLVEDHELFDTAMAWARKLAGQAPLRPAQIKRVSAAGDLDAGIEAEKRAFAEVFASADAREGIAAFLGKRAPHFTGK